MAEVRKVLIVGGGIGGLTAAIALGRQGILAEVVEINPAWSVYGVGIIQPSNALRALAQIGLAEACLQAGFGFPGWQMCDSNGTVLMEVPNENVGRPHFPANNGITRRALHKILSEATLAQKTPVHLGVTLESWTDLGDRVQVELTNGARETYDLVIAADGIHSATRAKLFGPDLDTRLTGESVWRYNFPRPLDMRWGSLHYGHFSKAGLVPMSDELMYLFLVTMELGNPRMPQDRLHEELRSRLSEYGGLVGSLRDQVTESAAVVYRPMETLLVPPPWNSGRIVMIGDAVHAGTPHLAQGAAMAVEDAVLLAQLLGKQQETLGTLQQFADRRFPRCELVMNTGLQMGEWEMAEWRGARSEDTDHGGLMGRAVAQLMLPV